jgi:hypothetical protein
MTLSCMLNGRVVTRPQQIAARKRASSAQLRCAGTLCHHPCMAQVRGLLLTVCIPEKMCLCRRPYDCEFSANTGASMLSMRVSSGDVSAGLRAASGDVGAEPPGSKATDWASIKVLPHRESVNHARCKVGRTVMSSGCPLEVQGDLTYGGHRSNCYVQAQAAAAKDEAKEAAAPHFEDFEAFAGRQLGGADDQHNPW